MQVSFLFEPGDLSLKVQVWYSCASIDVAPLWQDILQTLWLIYMRTYVTGHRMYTQFKWSNKRTDDAVSIQSGNICQDFPGFFSPWQRNIARITDRMSAGCTLNITILVLHLLRTRSRWSVGNFVAWLDAVLVKKKQRWRAQHPLSY